VNPVDPDSDPDPQHCFLFDIFVVFLLGVTTPPASPATLPPIYLQNFLQSTTVPASSTIFPSIHSQTFLQSDNSDTILALLVFMSFYAVSSTFFLCFYCMGFSLRKIISTPKSAPVPLRSPVPNSAPVPVPSDVVETWFSPLSTVCSSPSTVCSPPSTKPSQSESYFSEYSSPSSSSSTYGPSISNVHDKLCESYV